jgi:hypothetical protein
MTTESKQDEWVPFSVPLETAQSWISNWIDANPEGKQLSPTEMRAFVVRRADFVELLKQDDTEFIRMYIGRKEDLKEGRLRPCLLLVSAAHQKDIDPTGTDPDMIIDLVGPMVINTGNEAMEETYEVFDFSHGCPPYCDPESPLFIGPADENCG